MTADAEIGQQSLPRPVMSALLEWKALAERIQRDPDFAYALVSLPTNEKDKVLQLLNLVSDLEDLEDTEGLAELAQIFTSLRKPGDFSLWRLH